jgi:hypothetical protein
MLADPLLMFCGVCAVYDACFAVMLMSFKSFHLCLNCMQTLTVGSFHVQREFLKNHSICKCCFVMSIHVCRLSEVLLLQQVCNKALLFYVPLLLQCVRCVASCSA